MIASTGPRVFVSCGEASGDFYAAELAAALRRQRPGVQIDGFGGAALAAAGATMVGDYRGMAVTGLSEALAVVPRSWRMLRTIEAAARRARPDVFVAIDFPDFNFRLLPIMRRLGVPVVYYVSPQLWAWRAGRIRTICRHVARMLVIFPFEVPIYERAGVPVEFVGHPLVDRHAPSTTRDDLCRAHGIDPRARIVALLPGSRPNEVGPLLPVLLDASAAIRDAVPGTRFVVARAPSLDDHLFTAAGAPVAVVTGDTDSVLAAADLVITASGTATVQTALHERPMIIVYKVSPLTYAIGRRLVRVSHYGMANLVAGRTVVPELIQEACTPEAIAREAIALLTDDARLARMRRDLAEVHARLGAPGASDRAARAILSVVG